MNLEQNPESIIKSTRTLAIRIIRCALYSNMVNMFKEIKKRDLKTWAID